MAIILKSRKELDIMREAAEVNRQALGAIKAAISPGVTTRMLDKIAYDTLTECGATPAFLGYPPGGKHPFPATITIAVNDELVHGIPDDQPLQEGDLLSVDCGAVYKGYVADAAYTVGVGRISAEAQRLLDVTHDSLFVGIRACVVGNRFGDVSHAIQEFVESHGMNVVREYGGHGVGRSMHESPHIPNWGKPGKGKPLRAGMTFALEPMVMLGSPDVKVRNDHWTVVTADGALCAHFEHSVAVTSNGPEILTMWE